MIHLLPVFLLFHWQMYIFKSTKSMKLMQPGSVSHGQRLPINMSVLNKGPALMVFWKTSSHFNTEKSVSAFFSAWVVCSQFIHFYRTAWEPQICCTLLRNYSACCTTLEGQHEDIYNSALWVCGCVCVCVHACEIYTKLMFTVKVRVFFLHHGQSSQACYEKILASC